ncbi:ParA-like chromosome partition protein (plasmid) [Deinococcus geothermalis DSM 11300]|uniref:ParA-like chromosome partition protein n=1 Tax=Deinococcus geothermalis (strain DSM 11300 / CIP 105573 / AG-3a) TaxID=319795 RepID=A8ZRK2_DEIGD|nr:ParA family protein [Deinococcus geothermalis]ABW35111.1 ParA-like chromosome partition protein [Deinococcus geothermalis DSM 11300]
MRTIAITNQKGGVGKTTTAVHLAHALARQGLRILLVDTDGQGHCAIYLGLERRGDLSHVLLRTRQDTDDPQRRYEPVARFIRPNVRPGVDLISCDPSITLAEGRINGEAMRELRLARRLAEVQDRYDVALIDVGPKTDLLSTIALLAADSALIVSLPSTPDESLLDMTARLSALREDAGQGPTVLGVLATQVDSREGLTRDMQAKLQEAGFADVPAVPRSVALARAARAGKTIFETDPASPGAVAYAALATWLTARLEVNA